MKHLPGKSGNPEEGAKPVAPPADRGISRWKLALGAASLFFFVVGVKRSFRTDDGKEILQSDADLLDEQREQLKLSVRTETAPAATRPGSTRSRSGRGTEAGTGSERISESRSRSARKAGTDARSTRNAEPGARSGRKGAPMSEGTRRRSRTTRPPRSSDPDDRRRR